MLQLKRIIIIIVCIAFTASAKLSAQWTTIYLDSTHQITDIFCLNKDTCWVSGDKGLFMKTIDGGINWNKIPMDTAKNYGGIYFLNKDTGYLSSLPNEILKSFDGGNTWASNNPTTNCNGLLGGQCHAINFDTVFFSGRCDNFNYTLNVTYNSGLSVNEFTLPKPCNSQLNYIHKLYFPSDSIGYAIGIDEVLYKTANRGVTWNKIHEDCNSGNIDAYSMSCYNDSVCWFGGFGINSTPFGLKYSTDGGINWLSYINPQFGAVNDVAFFADGNGYIIVNRDIWKTIDYGITFNLQYTLIDTSPLPYYQIYKFQFLSSQTGYAASTHSILKTTNGGGSVGISENNSSGLIKLFPNPSSGEFTVSKFALFPGVWSLQIFDSYGKIVKQFFNINENEIHINLSDYPSGLYFVKSICGKKSTSSKVLIVK